MPSDIGQTGSALREYLKAADAKCPHCGHGLAGLDVTVCPECGRGLRVILAGPNRVKTLAWMVALSALMSCVFVVMSTVRTAWAAGERIWGIRTVGFSASCRRIW